MWYVLCKREMVRWYAYQLQDDPELVSQRLKAIETMAEDGTFDVLPKKEVIGLKKEWDKLREEPWRNQRYEEDSGRYLHCRS